MHTMEMDSLIKIDRAEMELVEIEGDDFFDLYEESLVEGDPLSPDDEF